jgi:putative membrane protein
MLKRLIAIIAVIGILGGSATWYLLDRRSAGDPVVAIVDSDEGELGKRVVAALEQSGEFTFGDTDSATATVELPTNFSTAVASLSTPQPTRADVAITTADTDLADRLASAVTLQVRQVGIDAALDPTAAARTTFSQLTLSSQLLGAGIGAAKSGAQQFSDGIPQLLGFLQTARDGSGQLAGAIDELNRVVGGASTQANGLAESLTATGLTVRSTTEGAAKLETGLTDVISLLRALPPTPQLTDAISRLEALQGAAHGVGDQLGGLSSTLGQSVDPDTDLGALLKSVVAQFSSASGQLSDGANQLAAGLATLSDQGGAQLTGVTDQLTAGVAQLEKVSTSVSDLAKKGLAATPNRNEAQQASVAATLSDPIAIDRSTSNHFELPSIAVLVAIALGLATAALAVAYLRLRKQVLASAQ